jgi:hypothetical protein
MAFFDHQNEGWPAFHVEVLSLCTGDSSFDHVLFHSKKVKDQQGFIKRPLPCIPMAKQAMFFGGRECEAMVFRCIPTFRCPMNLLFWTSAFSIFLIHLVLLLMILNLFGIMTGIARK